MEGPPYSRAVCLESLIAGATVAADTVSSRGTLDLVGMSVAGGTTFILPTTVALTTVVSNVTIEGGGLLALENPTVNAGGLLSLTAGTETGGAIVSSGGVLDGPGELQGDAPSFDYGLVSGVSLGDAAGGHGELNIESGGVARRVLEAGAADYLVVDSGGKVAITTRVTGTGCFLVRHRRRGTRERAFGPGGRRRGEPRPGGRNRTSFRRCRVRLRPIVADERTSRWRGDHRGAGNGDGVDHRLRRQSDRIVGRGGGCDADRVGRHADRVGWRRTDTRADPLRRRGDHLRDSDGRPDGEAGNSGTTGELQIDNLTDFRAKIGGLGGAGDKIDLGGFAFSSTGETVSWIQTGTSGTLTVHDGTKVAHLSLIGTYAKGDFNLAADGDGGTLISDPGGVPAAALAATRFVESVAGFHGPREMRAGIGVKSGAVPLLSAAPLVTDATSGMVGRRRTDYAVSRVAPTR